MFYSSKKSENSLITWKDITISEKQKDPDQKLWNMQISGF